MKTPQEIKELLEQVKLEGHLRRTPTDFVVLEVLLNLNDRLAAIEAKLALEQSRIDRLKALLESHLLD